MEKETFKYALLSSGCIDCGRGNVYRMKVLDPQNRQCEICITCLAKKLVTINEDDKNMICKEDNNGPKSVSKESNTSGERAGNINSPSKGSNEAVGNRISSEQSQRSGGLPKQV